MIELEDTLPLGAICSADLPSLQSDIGTLGAIWLSGQGDGMQLGPDGDLTQWVARNALGTATPASPNEGHGKPAYLGDLAGLATVPEVNCGMVLEGVCPNPTRFSAAVIYLPQAEGLSRTLWSMNTGTAQGNKDRGDYIFLSETHGEVTLKDTKGALELITQQTTGRRDEPRLIVASVQGGHMGMTCDTDRAAQIVTGPAPALSGPADFFIACRSHRRGLPKTLGGALILDVLLWPDCDLLIEPDAEARARLAALRQYYLWGYCAQ